MFKNFIRPVVKVLKHVDNSSAVLAAIKKLERQDVLMGVPQAESTRPGEPINNAELAFIHTEGSPANNIPPRPFLQPSVMAHKDNVSILQKKVIQAALAGDVNLVSVGLTKIGLYTQTTAQKWFTDPRNNWPPNAPYTIARKGSDKPLIDTGALRQSIKYVVRDS